MTQNEIVIKNNHTVVVVVGSSSIPHHGESRITMLDRWYL